MRLIQELGQAGLCRDPKVMAIWSLQDPFLPPPLLLESHLLAIVQGSVDMYLFSLMPLTIPVALCCPLAMCTLAVICSHHPLSTPHWDPVVLG